MSDFIVGNYKVVAATVNIRREPRIVNSTPTNVVGKLYRGDKRAVLDFSTDSAGFTWGRVSDYDAYGKANWICIQEPNKVFAEFESHLPEPTTKSETSSPTKEQKVRLYIDDELVYSKN